MITLTEENYLKAMYNLTRDDGEVTVNELSKHLNIKMPTTNSMMKKLSDKGYVYYESYKPLRLTEQGRKKALLVVRKHRLTEMFLVDIMGFGWEEVHEIAEEIEHIQTDSFFAKMDEMLNYPKVDPHGSPIPDKDGNIIDINYFKLNECETGDKVILSAVTHSSDEFLKFLNARNLSLGTEFEIKEIEGFDGSMQLKFGNGVEYVFSQKVCGLLLVEKI